MEYSRALHLPPIEILFGEIGAHPAQVKESAFARGFDKDY